MKKTFILMLLVGLLNLPLYGGISYAGGTGTEGDPYIINQLSHLQNLSLTKSDWDKHFKQTADIDASATSAWNDGAGWIPIGNDGTYFTGSYHGDGHTISLVHINRPATNYIGLFGYTYQASISNVKLIDVNISGQSYVGGLAGCNSGGAVSNCCVTGNVSAVSYVGGLTGYHINSGSISNCYVTATVGGSGSYTGGLVGYNSQSTVSNCYATGNVTSPSASVGGFAGYSYMAWIEDCYSTGKVYESPGTVWSTGNKGFIGDNYYDTTVDNFFDSEASEQASGIGATAKTTAEMKDHTTFINAGWDFTNIWALGNAIDGLNNYPRLKWDTPHTPAAEPGKIGEVYQISSLDDLRWIIENSIHWDKQYKQTANIDASATSAWDNGAGWSAIGTDSSKFTGSYDGDGYRIGNLFINRPEGDNQGLFGYILNSDITNLALNNVDITARYRVGGLAARPDNSSIENCSSSGTLHSLGDVTSTAGGLVGATYQAVIRNSYSSVHVTAEKARAGGLAGQIWGTSDHKTLVEKCYASGNVQGSTYIGGLIGLTNYGTIQNCYASGDVTRIAGSEGSGFGAFLGQENLSPGNTTIDKCYALGGVYYADAEDPTNKGFAGRAVSNASTIYTNNFFDSEASNQSTATGAVAKTTAEMKDHTTFIDAGWDFIEVWGMNGEINAGYPYLLSNVPDTPLPIALSAFSAVDANGSVKVTWVTESETENLAFRIYRNGELLAELEGAGTTSEPQDYHYTDNHVIPGKTYTYVLADVTIGNQEVKHSDKAVTITVGEGNVGKDYSIGTSYPNPFNPACMIPLNLAANANVNAALYDINGRLINELHNGALSAGSHDLKIDAANLATGIYLVKIRINDALHVQKIALMK